jgi:hypothetical protein
LLVAVVVLAWAPSLVGISKIHQPWIDSLEAGRFRLEVQSVRVGWFRPLELRGLNLYPIEGPGNQASSSTALLSIDRVLLDRGLLRLLLGGNKIGRITIDHPVVDVQLLQDGSNLGQVIEAVRKAAQAKQSGVASDPAKKIPKVDVDVAVRSLTLVLRDPKLTDPLVVAPNIELELRYRAAEGASNLHIAPALVLDQVDVTPELMRLGLELAVPILAQSAWIDGRISLRLGEVDIPLETPLQSQGQAELTFHSVQAGLNEPALMSVVQLLAKLMNRPPHEEILLADQSIVAVRVADGQVWHEGLKFGLPRLDPRMLVGSSGSVGIVDRSLALNIELPVPVELLARRDEVRQLGIPTITLPVTGTLQDPEVQWSALRQDSADLIAQIKERVADQAPGTAAVLGTLESIATGDADQLIDAASQLFRQLRDQRQKRRQEAQPDSPDPIKPSDQTNPNDTPRRNRPLRDRLRDALR